MKTEYKIWINHLSEEEKEILLQELYKLGYTWRSKNQSPNKLKGKHAVYLNNDGEVGNLTFLTDYYDSEYIFKNEDQEIEEIKI